MVRLATGVSALVTLLAAGAVVAHHTRELTKAEIVKRDELVSISRRSLAGCQSKLRKRGGVAERSMTRRQAFAERARKERGLATERPFLRKRDAESVASTSHHSNTTGLTTDSNPFDGNVSCVLAPDVTQGPYYVVGEYIRQDITEDEEGIPLYADVELIDVSTCEPATGYYMDFWHTNATGVYAGIVANGNGVGSEDPSNLNATFLRGIQQTSDEGYAQFISIFPGHYTSRATHIHVLVHQNDSTINDNGTLTGGTAAHVGQFFFDQDLINEADEVAPYSTNTQTIVEDEDDSIFGEEADTIDPVMEYVFLGDDITDGILAWGSFGIDTSESTTVQGAATLTEDGGVENESSDMGGSGGPGGSGSPPDASGASDAVSSTASGTSASASSSVSSSSTQKRYDMSLTNLITHPLRLLQKLR